MVDQLLMRRPMLFLQDYLGVLSILAMSLNWKFNI